MAEENPFTFSAAVDCHWRENVILSVGNFNVDLRYEYREEVTLAVQKCSLVTGKLLEKTKADTSKDREKHPDKLPVLVEKTDKNGKPIQMRFLIPSVSDVRTAFAEIWEGFHFAEEKPTPFYTIKSREAPGAFESFSTIYNKHKDEDGFLCMTLTSRFKPLKLPVCTRVFYDLRPEFQ